LKKYILIIGGIAAIIIVYLVVQNQQLQGDLSSSKAQAEDLNNYISETEQQIIHFDTAEIAENFVSSYFTFSDYPEEKDVENLITEDVKDKLTFGDSGQHAGEDESTESSVKDIAIYFGESTDNRQEVFATFNNLIEQDDVTSEEKSYLRMDIIQENEDWKIEDVEFDQ